MQGMLGMLMQMMEETARERKERKEEPNPVQFVRLMLVMFGPQSVVVLWCECRALIFVCAAYCNFSSMRFLRKEEAMYGRGMQEIHVQEQLLCSAFPRAIW